MGAGPHGIRERGTAPARQRDHRPAGRTPGRRSHRGPALRPRHGPAPARARTHPPRRPLTHTAIRRPRVPAPPHPIPGRGGAGPGARRCLPRRIRQERHLPGVLDRTGQLPLLLCGDAGDPTAADLAAVREERPEQGGVLVVDVRDARPVKGLGRGRDALRGAGRRVMAEPFSGVGEGKTGSRMRWRESRGTSESRVGEQGTCESSEAGPGKPEPVVRGTDQRQEGAVAPDTVRPPAPTARQTPPEAASTPRGRRRTPRPSAGTSRAVVSGRRGRGQGR